MARWQANADCSGDDQHRYFDPVDPENGPIDEAGLAFCRSRCYECPVRFECFEAAMNWEDGSAEPYRFAVFGGMTPQQRASLWRRGPESWRCAVCGQVYDPTALMRGVKACGECQPEVAAPVSDAGDAWSERHTALARAVIAWVLATFAPGDTVPSPTRYARERSIRKDDVTRVYRALVEDGIIQQTGRGQYVRLAQAGALRARGKASRLAREPVHRAASEA